MTTVFEAVAGVVSVPLLLVSGLMSLSCITAMLNELIDQYHIHFSFEDITPVETDMSILRQLLLGLKEFLQEILTNFGLNYWDRQWTNYRGDRVVLFVYTVVTMVILYAIYRLLGLKRFVCAMRGIKTSNMEAIVSGSGYTKGKMPAYQVDISTMTFFSSSHVGYGVRLLDVLIVPTHVLMVAGDEILVNGKLKIDSSSFTESLQFNDISYLRLNKEWHLLTGVKSAPIPKRDFTPGLVNCMGQNGMSTGYLEKARTEAQFSYLGSTEPGYSGAAYHSTGNFFGIHLGAEGDCNFGMAASVLYTEILTRFSKKSEASSDFNDPSSRRVQKEYWVHDSDYDKKITDIFNRVEGVGNEWAEDKPVDYNKRLNFDEESAKVLITMIKSFTVPSKQEAARKIQIQHAPGGPVQVVDLKTRQDAPGNIEVRLRLLETLVIRMAAFVGFGEDEPVSSPEAKAQPSFEAKQVPLDVNLDDVTDPMILTQPIQITEAIKPIRTEKKDLNVPDKKEEYFKCQYCNGVLNKNNIEKHLTLKHGRKVESVYPTDTNSLVSQNFSKARQPSQTKKSIVSQNTSTLSVALPPQKSLEDTLNGIQEYLSILKEHCSKSPKATGGQNLGTTQK